MIALESWNTNHATMDADSLQSTMIFAAVSIFFSIIIILTSYCCIDSYLKHYFSFLLRWAEVFLGERFWADSEALYMSYNMSTPLAVIRHHP